MPIKSTEGPTVFARSMLTHDERVHEQLSNPRRSSVIQLVESIILSAHEANASDIHIDPMRDQLQVRFRIDGIMIPAYDCSLSLHEEFIARLKILSGLRTDEHYAAQDGRFRMTLEREAWIDVRIAIAPTYYGENAVLRLLSPVVESRSLDALGFSPQHISTITRALKRKSGLLLVTGPTGSGKTTTLYALMQLLARESISLVSIEDPIEYSLPSVSQIPANQRAGLGFAQGLRSILRQDPDVIMVGEIRDEETAGLAVNAALTGHLVLSTMHTSDAVTAIPRLKDLHVEPYLIAATLRLVIGQRLVRKTCAACLAQPTEAPRACAPCAGSGFRGRIGIYEALAVDERFEEAITQQQSAQILRRAAHEGGMIPLREDGERKVRDGITTRIELARMEYA